MLFQFTRHYLINPHFHVTSCLCHFKLPHYIWIHNAPALFQKGWHLTSGSNQGVNQLPLSRGNPSGLPLLFIHILKIPLIWIVFSSKNMQFQYFSNIWMKVSSFCMLSPNPPVSRFFQFKKSKKTLSVFPCFWAIVFCTASLFFRFLTSNTFIFRVLLTYPEIGRMFDLVVSFVSVNA